MPTERQKMAAEKIVEGSRTQGDALREAGYAEGTAIKPSQVTQSKGFKEVAKPYLDAIKEERDRVIAAMRIANLTEVQYHKLASSLDILMKQVELLEGRATGRDESSSIEKVLREIYGRKNTNGGIEEVDSSGLQDGDGSTDEID